MPGVIPSRFSWWWSSSLCLCNRVCHLVIRSTYIIVFACLLSWNTYSARVILLVYWNCISFRSFANTDIIRVIRDFVCLVGSHCWSEEILGIRMRFGVSISQIHHERNRSVTSVLQYFLVGDWMSSWRTRPSVRSGRYVLQTQRPKLPRELTNRPLIPALAALLVAESKATILHRNWVTYVLLEGGHDLLAAHWSLCR